MTDTGTELDEILSGEKNTPAETTETTTETTQPRDEHGRFANTTATETTPVDGSVTQPPAQTATTEDRPGAMVPQQALHAERQKNQTLEAQLAELRGQVQTLLAQPRQPAPAQVQQEAPKPKKDFWEDPDTFTAERVQSALSPVEQLVKGMIFNTSHQNALRDPAIGQEKVTAAEAWVKEAVQAGRIDGRALAAKLSTSFDPVGDVVRLYQKESALQRVGNDPDAFVQAELAKMLADPAKQAEILRQIQASANGNQSQNGQSPTTQLPPSISRLPGGANTVTQMDMSDEARFARATGAAA